MDPLQEKPKDPRTALYRWILVPLAFAYLDPGSSYRLVPPRTASSAVQSALYRFRGSSSGQAVLSWTVYNVSVQRLKLIELG